MPPALPPAAGIHVHALAEQAAAKHAQHQARGRAAWEEDWAAAIRNDGDSSSSFAASGRALQASSKAAADSSCPPAPLNPKSPMNYMSSQLPYMDLRLLSSTSPSAATASAGGTCSCPCSSKEAEAGQGDEGGESGKGGSGAKSKGAASKASGQQQGEEAGEEAEAAAGKGGISQGYRPSGMLPAIGGRASGALNPPGLDQQYEAALPYARRTHPSGAAVKDRLAVRAPKGLAGLWLASGPALAATGRDGLLGTKPPGPSTVIAPAFQCATQAVYLHADRSPQSDALLSCSIRKLNRHVGKATQLDM